MSPAPAAEVMASRSGFVQIVFVIERPGVPRLAAESFVDATSPVSTVFPAAGVVVPEMSTVFVRTSPLVVSEPSWYCSRMNAV